MSFTNEENSSIQKPRVSVLVPSYNHSAFIETCLNSIIKQTFIPSELLVIDDGSKDDSPKVIERVLKDCTFRSELIVRPNKGLCATLNEGFEKTAGDYFAYLGSDDVWLPEFIRARVSLLESRPKAALGYGHVFLIDEHSKIIDCSNNWADYPDGNARPLLLRGAAPFSSTVFFRRATLDKHRWNEEAKLEDYELYLQLSEDYEFAFDKQVLSCWRAHDYNTSRNQIMMLRECLDAQKRVAKIKGWSDAELNKIQTTTRFHYVEEFARKGFKTKALSLLLKNIRGTPSAKALIKQLLLIALPMPFFKLRRNYMKYKTAKSYGTFED